MSLKKDTIMWIHRGRQRSAILQVLRKPMTATEICRAARTLAPRIQLQDIWLLMRQFNERNLTLCFNPKQTAGRLYFLTDYGRGIVQKAFGKKVVQAPPSTDWRRYAWVVRAKLRRVTLLSVAKLQERSELRSRLWLCRVV